MAVSDTTVLYWNDSPASPPVDTGIQRVRRRLGDCLRRQGVDLLPVGFDQRTRLLRPIPPASSRSARDADPIKGAAWLLVPDIPMTVVGADLDPVQLARAYGLRAAAIVHDLIPMRLAHLYTPEAQAPFRRYYRMFAGADLVFATSRLVAGHLREHLMSEDLRVPEIAIVPLPGQFAELPRVVQRRGTRDPGETLRLLTVSTWEPRKNLPTLLRSVQRARERSGLAIAITLVGQRGIYVDLDAELDALLTDLPGCDAHHQASDAQVAALYATCHASVYSSCDEGFGLPVLESLWLGRPCLCHAGSAMAEVAPGGGTLMLDMSDCETLTEGLLRLAMEPDLLDRLTSELLARPLRNWMDYAADVAERMNLTA